MIDDIVSKELAKLKFQVRLLGEATGDYSIPKLVTKMDWTEEILKKVDGVFEKHNDTLFGEKWISLGAVKSELLDLLEKYHKVKDYNDFKEIVLAFYHSGEYEVICALFAITPPYTCSEFDCIKIDYLARKGENTLKELKESLTIYE